MSDISAVFLHSFAPLGFINQPRINHFHTLCLETTEVGGASQGRIAPARNLAILKNKKTG